MSDSDRNYPVFNLLVFYATGGGAAGSVAYLLFYLPFADTGLSLPALYPFPQALITDLVHMAINLLLFMLIGATVGSPLALLCGLTLCLIRPYRNAAGFFCAACAGAASGMAARFIPFYSYLPDTLKLVVLCTAASLLTAAFALPNPPQAA